MSDERKPWNRAWPSVPPLRRTREQVMEGLLLKILDHTHGDYVELWTGPHGSSLRLDQYLPTLEPDEAVLIGGLLERIRQVP